MTLSLLIFGWTVTALLGIITLGSALAVQRANTVNDQPTARRNRESRDRVALAASTLAVLMSTFTAAQAFGVLR